MKSVNDQYANVSALDEAAANWGVKVLRYEIKDLVPPAEILRAMQAQITAEREKRALIAASEGRKQEQINIATGERGPPSPAPKVKNKPPSTARKVKPPRFYQSPKRTPPLYVRLAKRPAEGGMNTVNLKVAEQYVAAFKTWQKQQYPRRTGQYGC